MALYGLLFLLGISNILRFRSINGMTQSLILIYSFSSLEIVSIITWLNMLPYSNLYSYVPYAAIVYMKIILGISFMNSVFELRFAIDHFFKKTSIEKYKKNLRITFWIKLVLILLLLALFVTDIYFNYYEKFIRATTKRLDFHFL